MYPGKSQEKDWLSQEHYVQLKIKKTFPDYFINVTFN